MAVIHDDCVRKLDNLLLQGAFQRKKLVPWDTLCANLLRPMRVISWVSNKLPKPRFKPYLSDGLRCLPEFHNLHSGVRDAMTEWNDFPKPGVTLIIKGAAFLEPPKQSLIGQTLDSIIPNRVRVNAVVSNSADAEEDDNILEEAVEDAVEFVSRILHLESVETQCKTNWTNSDTHVSWVYSQPVFALEITNLFCRMNLSILEPFQKQNSNRVSRSTCLWRVKASLREMPV